MSMIEGFGDEVVQFFSLLFVTVLGFIAWWSTGIREERPQIRTVLILEHRSPNGINVSDATLTPDRDNTTVLSSSRSNSTSESAENNVQAEIKSHGSNVSQAGSNSNVIRKRLGFFNNSAECSHSTEPIQTSGLRETSESVSHSASGEAGSIRIRLKYLNDDQKLVEGRLQEMLGEFKRRHFSVELSTDKLVRLIFNGQVLHSDDRTLQGYGLYDNCVVHCLVHTQRSLNRTHNQQQINSPPPEWNLGILLYICISVILGLGWFVRYNYSQLFTLATTSCLVGLTGIFAVSVIGLYMPDQEPVLSQ
ncbi:hypothetical protein AAG570_000027 [Ranatra chinensis]|uniref:Ubiquitin-like domain-containing protein n=1 Tax=Ranatra chinensis TaxID=642074 RepID=A0ABD0YW53_9HEMI